MMLTLYDEGMHGGQLVREARLRAGWSQRRLATASGLSQATIARIESGDTRPTMQQVQRLVEACGLQLCLGLVARDDADWSVAQANLRLDPDARVRQHQTALRFVRAGRAARAAHEVGAGRRTRTAGQPRPRGRP